MGFASFKRLPRFLARVSKAVSSPSAETFLKAPQPLEGLSVMNPLPDTVILYTRILQALAYLHS